MSGPGRFAFVDEGEAVRRLGVDRDTILGWVRSGRLKAYPGVGKGSFFKLSDLTALARELAPAEQPTPAAEAPAAEAGQAAPGRPRHDPAYKVHLRLQADLKWYDLSDDDLRLWVRELHPDGYERQRTNIQMVITRLERLQTLMDAAAAGWKSRPPDAPTPDNPPREG
ncbi:MAG TPA: helix-turn-helix domain-containing protein [Ktedonobacterales bacterium]|nr:helix-turn-helix domain-containing protein [Ktedonobacterales bacterium]